jgi:hypothetical protein
VQRSQTSDDMAQQDKSSGASNVNVNLVVHGSELSEWQTRVVKPNAEPSPPLASTPFEVTPEKPSLTFIFFPLCF